MVPISTLSALNDDAQLPKGQRAYFIDDENGKYEKFAVPVKPKLRMIAQHKVSDKLKQYKCMERRKIVMTHFKPAVQASRSLPQPDLIRQAILSQANEEIKALEIKSKKFEIENE